MSENRREMTVQELEQMYWDRFVEEGPEYLNTEEASRLSILIDSQTGYGKVSPYDNHEEHIKQHIEELKHYAIWDPGRAEKVKWHIREHQKVWANEEDGMKILGESLNAKKT